MKTWFVFMQCFGIICCLLSACVAPKPVDATGAQRIGLAADLERNETKKLSSHFTVECGQTYLMVVFISDDGLPIPSESHNQLKWNVKCPDGQVLSGSTNVYTQHRLWSEIIKDGDLEQVKQDMFPGILVDYRVFTVPSDDEQHISDVTKALRSAFRKYFRDTRLGELDIERSHANIHVFFCDVDGDGVEEAFAVASGDYDRSGFFWKVFCYQNGTWHEMGNGIDRFHYLSDPAWRFYCRDDVNEQPRLFIDTCIRDNPKAVVITKDNKIIEVPFDRRDYEDLREEGLLKPIKSHWYDKDDKVMITGYSQSDDKTGTIKGDNKPISPYASYGDSDFINEQGAVHGTFQRLYQSAVERCSNTEALYVFSFDVDGDWLDEWFVTCDAMASASGSEWHVFRGQHENWQELKVTGITNRLYAPASRFYCREDTREQPRLFIDTCITNSPLAITLEWDKSLRIDPFDRQEYERLREKGILKPAGGWWYNTQYGLDIRTIAGDNKPIKPGDRFPYEDATPGLDRTAYFDHGVPSGDLQSIILSGAGGKEYISKKLSSLPLAPGLKYLFAVFVSDDGLSVPPEDLIPLEWNITLPDGQVFSGSTNVYSLQRTWFMVMKGDDLEQAKQDHIPGYLLDYHIAIVPNDDAMQEVQTEQDMQVVFVKAIQSYLARHSVSDKLNYVIFFDIDGDGISDEAVFATRHDTFQNGCDWQAFYCKDGIWQQAKHHRVASSLFPWDFYYREGMKQEARLFVRNYGSYGLLSFSCINVGDNRYWERSLVDKTEFDDLLEKGILKKVTWYWCDDDNNLYVGENPEEIN